MILIYIIRNHYGTKNLLHTMEVNYGALYLGLPEYLKYIIWSFKLKLKKYLQSV